MLKLTRDEAELVFELLNFVPSVDVPLCEEELALREKVERYLEEGAV